MDKALFDAWRIGDREARDECWMEALGKLDAWAAHYLRPVCNNWPEANERGADAVCDTICEIEEKIVQGSFAWQGESSFWKFVRRKLTWRLQDQIRTLIAFNCLVDLDDVAEIAENESHDPFHLVAVRTSIEWLISELNSIRKESTDEANTAEALLACMLVSFHAMNTIDTPIAELLKTAELGSIGIDKTDLLACVSERLKITPRERDSRLFRLRRVLLQRKGAE